MHPFIRFLKEHPHCTKTTCTTCGGLIAFTFELTKWSEDERINLPDLIGSLSIEDLESLENWSLYMARVIDLIPISQFQRSILPIWRKYAEKSVEFSEFLLFHVPSNKYDSKLDKNWFQHYLISQSNRFSLYDLQIVEDYLGNNIVDFPEILLKKQEKIKENEFVVRLRKQADEQNKKQRAIDDEAWKNKLKQLEQLQPLERLFILLKDTERDLDDYPMEWANIPVEEFQGWNSNKLTEILHLFSYRISRRKKGPWKDLRSRIYLLRQEVYNKEHYQRRIE